MRLRHFSRLPVPAARVAAVAVLALAVALSAGATDVLEPLIDPYQPPSTGGVARADRLLAKLSVHKRLLVVGAHPDDEDTTLLSLVSRGEGGEAAYLSLSRGEGGQNLIGSELGVGLGLLRSRELLAARATDGARQFFTRAFDFGYTRSIEETLRKWPREALLPDAARVVRRFRPQVIVSVFPPDERAGHGQHQAAGIVAAEVYALAGDAAAFPEAGPPWAPQALYRGAFFDREAATATLQLGVLEPVSGRSIFQIAMASRSQHRSQDMGMLQPLGPRTTALAWVAGGAGAASDSPWAGIDTRLAAIATPLPDGEPRREIEERLARVEAQARQARAGLAPDSLAAALPAALAIEGELAAARALLPERPDDPAAAAVADLLDEKRAVAVELVVAAAGIAADATADRAQVVPGEPFLIEAALWSSAGAAAVELGGVRLASPGGVELFARDEEVPERTGFEARLFGNADPGAGFHLRALRVNAVPGSPATVPYFLRRPMAGDLYDWSAAPAGWQGEPFEPPVATVEFRLRVALPGEPAAAGREIVLTREVVHRRRDQALGEIRRPLAVVPAVEVALARDLEVWPAAGAGPRPVEVTVTSRSTAPVAGRVELTLPEGWPPVEPRPFALAGDGERQTLGFTVSPPAPLAPGSYRVRAVAALDGDGGRFDLALPIVDEPHVRPTPWPHPAEAAVTAVDLALPPLAAIGYVAGPADPVPALLRQVGLPVVTLAPADLSGGDLARFDAVVVGSRAYETVPALAAANPRLLDYARGGGLLLVLYQQYPFVDGGFAPFPLTIARPHGRVTDETSPVTVLELSHPAFTRPNRIGPADWRGWVQERGLYFAGTWDAAYTPLLTLADPGGGPQSGALLMARLGEGTYVYTGLAFFRQLPSGVPGAYRLLANLLALGAK